MHFNLVLLIVIQHFKAMIQLKHNFVKQFELLWYNISIIIIYDSTDRSQFLYFSILNSYKEIS